MKAEISYTSVWKVMGWLLLVLAILLLPPLLVEICCGGDSVVGFLIAEGICLTVGLPVSGSLRRHYARIRRREGFLLVSIVWVVFSLVGMIPFLTGTHPLSLSDAFFETMSGFTTTGATTIADVESLSKGLLLWRAMTQWIGGLGIILLVLAILPSLNERGGVPMYNAEVTGITHDKIHPRIRQTAMALWKVYGCLTLMLVVLLWAGPMDFFDALCQALAGISTGGFSTRNAGIAFWDSIYVDIVLTIFMFVGGVNFTLIYQACRGKWRSLTHNDVFRAYCLIVFAAWILSALTVASGSDALNGETLIVQPLFHVISTITTTGFAIRDIGDFAPLYLAVTIALMLCGACAGSTTGAIKVDRLVALVRNLRNEVKLSIHPSRVLPVKVNNRALSRPEISRITAFVSIYMLMVMLGVGTLSVFQIELSDSLFAVVSCLGNNGLGYGLTGAAGGFHLLPDATKWLLALMMLIGRLELFSLFVLLSPSFWRK